MDIKDLKPGRAYFTCAYLLRHSPVPEIETWIYVGANLLDGDHRLDEVYHYFQDPGSYFMDQMLNRIAREHTHEFERADAPVRLRVRESELGDAVQDLTELQMFVMGLSGEANAHKTF